MGRERKYFECKQRFAPPRKISWQEANDLLEICEDAYEQCQNPLEDYYRQIALLHLLIGYPNSDKNYNEGNIRINQWIYKLHNQIEEYRKKYGH